jgi:hypothetical protein
MSFSYPLIATRKLKGIRQRAVSGCTFSPFSLKPDANQPMSLAWDMLLYHF